MEYRYGKIEYAPCMKEFIRREWTLNLPRIQHSDDRVHDRYILSVKEQLGIFNVIHLIFSVLQRGRH